MGREYKNVIFTDHALKRLKLRRITQEMIITTIHQPDRREKEDDGDSEFIKLVNGRKVHVISVYLPDEHKWLVKSAWVRGEDDPKPLWQRLLRGLLHLLGGR